MKARTRCGDSHTPHIFAQYASKGKEGGYRETDQQLRVSLTTKLARAWYLALARKGIMGRKSRRKKERNVINRNISEYKIETLQEDTTLLELMVQEYHPLGTEPLKEKDFTNVEGIMPADKPNIKLIGALCHDLPEHRFLSIIANRKDYILCVYPKPNNDDRDTILKVVKEFV